MPQTVGIRMPNSTSILHMGLTAEQLKALTPNARKLRKGDLTALGDDNPDAVITKMHLTVEDVNSIKTAFANYQSPHGSVGHGEADMSISCCCCTPCCCAAAVMEPIRPFA